MNGLILFEDDHLLVVNKPSGINTHKPDRFAPDGIHEWLTQREPRWRHLSILQRLDKDTSGVMVFGVVLFAIGCFAAVGRIEALVNKSRAAR